MVVIDDADFLAVYPDDGPQDVALFLPPGRTRSPRATDSWRRSAGASSSRRS